MDGFNRQPNNLPVNSRPTTYSQRPITAAPTPQPVAQSDYQSPPQSLPPPRKKSAGKIFVIVLLVIVLLAITAGGGYTYYKTYVAKNNLSKSVANLNNRIATLEAPVKYVQDQVEQDKIQAVFLSNSQVYFGKITHIDQNFLTLEDIYYLRNGTISKDGKVTGSDASLVKLGKELHGPEDKMVIERKSITFWENLKADGEVAKAIAAYEKANTKSQPSSSNSSSPLNSTNSGNSNPTIQ